MERINNWASLERKFCNWEVFYYDNNGYKVIWEDNISYEKAVRTWQFLHHNHPFLQFTDYDVMS
ncbi:MAG: hypothetical protein V1759_01565 [bacterium]